MIQILLTNGKEVRRQKRKCVCMCACACVLPHPSFVLRQDVAPFKNGVPRERKKPLAKSSRSMWKLRMTTVGVVKFVLFTIYKLSSLN